MSDLSSPSSTPPAVSVILPVYNAERFITAAVESILAQSFTDFELIVIDDGSQDRSPDILRRFAERDRRIRFVTRPNQGLVATLNEGIDLARAPLIARMDADDISLPNRLALQVPRFAQDNQLVCLGGGYLLMDPPGRSLRRIDPPTEHAALDEALLTGHNMISHPTVMLRTEVVKRLGGYHADTWPAEDLDLWLRMAEAGTLGAVPEVVLKYRLHPDSICEQNRTIQQERAREVCQRAWKRRGIDRSYTAGNPWRPGNDRQSQYEYLLSFGWSAFYLEEWKTAVVYGLKAAAQLPFRSGGWKLAAVAMLKRGKCQGVE